MIGGNCYKIHPPHNWEDVNFQFTRSHQQNTRETNVMLLIRKRVDVVNDNYLTMLSICLGCEFFRFKEFFHGFFIVKFVCNLKFMAGVTGLSEKILK